MAHKLKENKVNSLPSETHEEYIQNLTESLAVINEEQPELTYIAKPENHDIPKNADDRSPLTHSQLIQDQQADPKLAPFSQETITEEETQDNPMCYFKRSGVLMKKWRLPIAPAADKTGKLYIRLLFLGIGTGMC